METEQCFIDLNSIDKPDWHNIPIPLIKALRTIKKCLVSLMYGIKQNTDNIQEVNRENSFLINGIDAEVKSMRKSVISSEDIVKETLKDITEKLNTSTTNFKSFLNSEFEGMKKNYDSKFVNVEQQMKTFGNQLKGFPKYEEIERMIKAALRENNANFEVELKEDIRKSMVDPEARKNSDKFDLVEMFKEEVKQKMLQQTEDCSKMVKLLSYETDEKMQKLKKFSEGLMKNMEKNQEDSDFALQEVSGKTDFLHKSLTEKITALSLEMIEISESAQKPLSEYKSALNQLSQDFEAFKSSIPPASPTAIYDRQATIEIAESLSLQSPGQILNEINPNPIKLRKKKQAPNKVKEEVQKLKAELLERSSQNEEFVKQNFKNFTSEVQNSIDSLRKEMYDSVFEVREKLHWLPVNVSQIKGMPPNEARVFILEARLRAEENARNEQIGKVMNIIDFIKNEIRSHSENTVYGATLPSIGSMTFDGKTGEEMKEFNRKITNWVRDLPTPEKIRLRHKNYPKVSVSVDLAKAKQRRLSS